MVKIITFSLDEDPLEHVFTDALEDAFEDAMPLNFSQVVESGEQNKGAAQ